MYGSSGQKYSPRRPQNTKAPETTPGSAAAQAIARMNQVTDDAITGADIVIDDGGGGAFVPPADWPRQQVCGNIIGRARTTYVGRSQSCMVGNGRCRQRLAKGERFHSVDGGSSSGQE